LRTTARRLDDHVEIVLWTAGWLIAEGEAKPQLPACLHVQQVAVELARCAEVVRRLLPVVDELKHEVGAQLRGDRRRHEHRAEALVVIWQARVVSDGIWSGEPAGAV